MALTLTVDDRHPTAVVLSVSGEVDLATAPRLRERLVQLVTDGHRCVVVDMAGVDFLDSTGLDRAFAIHPSLDAALDAALAG